jgi:hypothetical protein
MTQAERDGVESVGNRQLVDALGTFLASFHWQVYATPSFKAPVNRHHARLAAERWITTLGPNVFAYIAYEEGRAGGRTHCHALVGGLGGIPTRKSGLSIRDLALKKVERAWRHGNIEVASFDPRLGGCWYAAKFPNDGEIVGVMRHHRVRRHRE